MKLNKYFKTIFAVIIIAIITAVIFSPVFNINLFGIRAKRDTLIIYSVYTKNGSQIINNASCSV